MSCGLAWRCIPPHASHPPASPDAHAPVLCPGGSTRASAHMRAQFQLSSISLKGPPRHVTLLQGHSRLISASWLSDMKNSYYSWTYKWEAYSSDTIQTLNILRDTVENRHLKKTILTLRSHVAIIHFSVCDEEFIKFEMSLVEYGIASGHVETAWRKRFTSIQRVHSISSFFLQ